jgi:hypothetical protein
MIVVKLLVTVVKLLVTNQFHLRKTGGRVASIAASTKTKGDPMKKEAFTKIRVVAVTLVALIVVSATTYVVAITNTGEGSIKRFDGVQVVELPDAVCTSSFPDFEDMPGMSAPFTMHGKGRVVVLFQGQFGGLSSTAGARATIRLTIDGNIVGSAIAISNDHGTGLQTFGFNAFSDELGPGTHTAQVLWHTSPGATSCVEERSLIILHE